MKKRIKGVQGGTSASKTISILQILIDDCQRGKKGEVTSVTSESFPHLKRGAIRDFLNIMNDHEYFEDARWNKSDYIYTFETGAMLEFFSSDQPSKVRGPRRKRLFINEANHIPLETFDQLEVRTADEIYMDWNPSEEFWFYTDVLPKRDDVELLILTYEDNEGLPESVRKSIEQRRNRPGWWKVFGLGQLGEVEGKIYKDWKVDLPEIPHEAKFVVTGLDFGYSNDPTSIVNIYKWNGAYVLDEMCYQQGMSNREIAEVLKNRMENVLVVADSAEPKSIDEIFGYGINIIPATKGQGSVNTGIQFVQDQRIFVTSRSVNIIKEYRNYLWTVDKMGRILNVPEHQFSHSMDAIRYGLNSLNQSATRSVKVFKPERAGYQRSMLSKYRI